MAQVIEHSFRLFSESEIELGLNYAAQKDMVTLNYVRLRTIANNAGKNRINSEKKLTPREAASRALQGFQREFPGTRLSPREFEGYVHAVAKMLSERSPRTSAKRIKDKEAEEILALNHKIAETPDIDPEINRQIGLMLQSGSNYEK